MELILLSVKINILKLKSKCYFMTWRVEDRRDSFKNICHQRKYKQQKTKTTDKIWEYFGGLDKIKQWARWHLVDDTSSRKSARKQNLSPLSCSSWGQSTSKIVKNSRHLNEMFFPHLAVSYLSAHMSPKLPAGSILHPSQLTHTPLPRLCFYL